MHQRLKEVIPLGFASTEIATPKTEIEIATSAQVRRWLRKHEFDFMVALRRFGEKMEIGFQQIASTKGFEDFFKYHPYLPKQYKQPTDPWEGEFTGSGMCSIASGILEKALREKFSNQIDVRAVFFFTNDMDIETGQDLNLKPPSPHHVVRFRTLGDEWWTVDFTYRQFQIKLKPLRMVMFPTRNEPRLYTYPQWFDYYMIQDPTQAPAFIPEEKSVNELHRCHLARVGTDNIFMKHIQKKDYLELIEVFRE